MATKKCASEHCEQTFEAKGARKFCDLHAGVKKPKAAKKAAPKASINAEFSRFVVPIMVDENQLDELWHKMPIEEKALAIQLYWDNLEA